MLNNQNVKHRMFSLYVLQKQQQWVWFCPFVMCLSWVSSPVRMVTAQALKDELSGTAKMDEELSLIALEHKDCSRTDRMGIILKQQP